MNLPKITGYVGLVTILVSALSKLAAAIIPEYYYSDKLSDILRWADYIWAYGSLTMGYYLAKTFHMPLHVLLGCAIAILCIVLGPGPGVCLGILYFFWAFAILDRSPDTKLPDLWDRFFR